MKRTTLESTVQINTPNGRKITSVTQIFSLMIT